jgi:hypothetical protein
MPGFGTIGEPYGSIGGALFNTAARANLVFAVQAKISLGRLYVVIPVAGSHEEPLVRRINWIGATMLLSPLS